MHGSEVVSEFADELTNAIWRNSATTARVAAVLVLEPLTCGSAQDLLYFMEEILLEA